jgi:hypothetical protein
MDCGADLPDCKYEKVNPNLAYMESLDRKALPLRRPLPKDALAMRELFRKTG